MSSYEEEIGTQTHQECAHTEERPSEDTVRRLPCESQGERLQRKPNLLTP